MAEPLCVANCGRPSPDAFLCQSCAYRLERTYAEMPAQLTDLEVTLTRQSNAGRGGQSKHTKASEQPLAFDVAASDLADAVRNALSSQIRDLCASRGVECSRIVLTTDMAVWLASQVDSIRQDNAAGKYFTEAIKLAWRLRSAVDNHEQHYAGICNAEFEDIELRLSETPRVLINGVQIEFTDVLSPSVEVVTRGNCGAVMHMRPSAPTITCRACGAEYNTVERMRWMLDREPDHLGTIAFIDSALVTAGYIQPGNAVKWLQRDERRAADARRFFPWRTDGLGHDLFRLGDFVERAKMGDVRRMTRVTQELGATG